MKCNYIESLIIKCKSNYKASKKLLAEQFGPLIINRSKHTFIHGYMQNEYYRNFFHCIDLYNPEKRHFVAYATNSIKNNIKDPYPSTKTEALLKEVKFLLLLTSLNYIFRMKKNILMKIYAYILIIL